MSIYQKLFKVQQEVKAPKNLNNSFGKYKYRSLESILESAKPVLAKYNCGIHFEDEIIFMEGRFYLKATAVFFDAEATAEGQVIKVPSLARESDVKKGMDSAQVTGASSSYARKYAISALLAIDDSKEQVDSSDNSGQLPTLRKGTPSWDNVKKALNEGFTIEQARTKYVISEKLAKELQ